MYYKLTLYGLRSSRLVLHDILVDCLRDVYFSPCMAEPVIWMREKDSLYEYIVVYSDNLAIATTL